MCMCVCVRAHARARARACVCIRFYMAVLKLSLKDSLLSQLKANTSSLKHDVPGFFAIPKPGLRSRLFQCRNVGLETICRDDEPLRTAVRLDGFLRCRRTTTRVDRCVVQ